jgi:hypothetical protein
MTELTLLLPERRRLLPGLALTRWLVRGDRLTDADPGRDAVLRGCFEFIGTTVPVAALTRSLDANDAAGALWLRADPAWVMADAVTLRLMACGNVGLSVDESAALARALKPLFGDAGFPLEPTSPTRWYLHCPRGAQLPAFSPPADALGDDVARHLPEGDAGRRWRHLLNEAQVILHNHPVNAERARRGAAPVNSVWPWGAGKLPEWVRTNYSPVLSADDVAVALARRAQVDTRLPEPGGLETWADEARVLVDLADMGDGAALERQWLAPLQAGLAARRITGVNVHFESGERYRYRHAHRWRLWRRLPAAAAE